MRTRSIVGGVSVTRRMVRLPRANGAKGARCGATGAGETLANAKSPAAAEPADLTSIIPEFSLGPTDVRKEYRQAIALIASINVCRGREYLSGAGRESYFSRTSRDLSRRETRSQ